MYHRLTKELLRNLKEEIKLGRRYCSCRAGACCNGGIADWLNAVTKLKDGSFKVRIEGLYIG